MTSKLIFDLGGLAVLIFFLAYITRRATKSEATRQPLLDESIRLQRESQTARLQSLEIQQETLAEFRKANKLLEEIAAASKAK